jgi:hypothetical protein
MRNLVLLLIALFALVTFIRAFDTADAESLDKPPFQQAAVETTILGN